MKVRMLELEHSLFVQKRYKDREHYKMAIENEFQE